MNMKNNILIFCLISLSAMTSNNQKKSALPKLTSPVNIDVKLESDESGKMIAIIGYPVVPEYMLGYITKLLKNTYGPLSDANWKNKPTKFVYTCEGELLQLPE